MRTRSACESLVCVCLVTSLFGLVGVIRWWFYCFGEYVNPTKLTLVFCRVVVYLFMLFSFLISFCFPPSPFLPSSAPPSLPPSLSSSLPPFLPPCLPPSLPSFLPSFLSSFLPPSLPSSLPSFLPFLLSFFLYLFSLINFN